MDKISTRSHEAGSKHDIAPVGDARPDIQIENVRPASQAIASIVCLETAVPPYYVSQKDAFAYLVGNFPQFSEMAGVFTNSGIDGRYSSVPTQWYDEAKGWAECNRTYIDNALVLLQDAATRALEAAKLAPADVDAVVMVSSTGFSMPSLDARLAERMHFRPDVERTPISGLGCAGGVTGMARAAKLAQISPGSNVLLLVMELEGLNSRMAADSGAFLISSALFGDGAAAAIIRAGMPMENAGCPVIGPTGEYRCKDTLDLMGWSFADSGLDVVLSGKVPSFFRRELGPLVCDFLERHGMTQDNIRGFLVHPGGPKVLEAVQSALDLEDDTLASSHDVMRQYGNMSSPTVLFILQQALRDGACGRHLLVAPGPGLTVSFAIVDL